MNILITGGGDGLGKEIAKLHLKKGHSVFVLDIAFNWNAEAYGFENQLFLIPFNLEEPDTKPLKKILKKPIDFLYLNAGISLSGDYRIEEIKRERKVFDVNYWGHIELFKFLLADNHLLKGGHIALTLSSTAFFPFLIAPGYSASKAAIENYFFSIEPQLKFFNSIGISFIYPGPIKTAHAKKYYKKFDKEKGSDPKKVAYSIVKCVLKRKGKIFPDKVSLLFYLLSNLCPRLLALFSYKSYKDLYERE